VNPRRRRWLRALAAWTAGPALAHAPRTARAEPVQRGRPLAFPRDHGAHVDARTEWWYLTGWLGRPEAPSHGVQITFFRSRTGLADALPGRLAPRQLLFAHAALTDLGARTHRHDQRLVRWNGDTGAIHTAQNTAAGADDDDTRVWIGDWVLQRNPEGPQAHYQARWRADGWSAALRLQTTQPLLLQGEAGFSRKGPLETQASHYYSQPQLALQARLQIPDGPAVEASGRAWLDHEWSDEILAADAVGWDWVGFNLFDGAALTAFRLRRADGSPLWAGGGFRAGSAPPAQVFAPDAVRWTARRHWRSPATGALYPVEWRLDTPAGVFGVRALLDAQELDGRQSTGTVYWEGLSELLDAQGRRIGLGYLEMTGYAGRLQL
jgi:predicted secreted hydrolase